MAPQIEVDEQGRLMFQIGQGACQVLLPVQLNATQANSIDISAIFGATLAAQPGASDGALAFTLGDQTSRLVPHWVLSGNNVAQTAPWRTGIDGLLYLKLTKITELLVMSDACR